MNILIARDQPSYSHLHHSLCTHLFFLTLSCVLECSQCSVSSGKGKQEKDDRDSTPWCLRQGPSYLLENTQHVVKTIIELPRFQQVISQMRRLLARVTCARLLRGNQWLALYWSDVRFWNPRARADTVCQDPTSTSTRVGRDSVEKERDEWGDLGENIFGHLGHRIHGGLGRLSGCHYWIDAWSHSEVRRSHRHHGC